MYESLPIEVKPFLAPPLNTAALQSAVIAAENRTISETSLPHLLKILLLTPEGRKAFAEAFYYVRYDFCRLNHLVAARCGTNDHLAAPLVANLWEEHGRGRMPTHNELYRRFLRSVGAEESSLPPEPQFARHFNSAWEAYCVTQPLERALLALGVYEIFDNPDYQFLLAAVSEARVARIGLAFFAVHANATHFTLFDKPLSNLLREQAALEDLGHALRFVFATQRRMWEGLAQYLRTALPHAAFISR